MNQWQTLVQIKFLTIDLIVHLVKPVTNNSPVNAPVKKDLIAAHPPHILYKWILRTEPGINSILRICTTNTTLK